MSHVVVVVGMLVLVALAGYFFIKKSGKAGTSATPLPSANTPSKGKAGSNQ